ncbi:MAG TPA: monovalent cation/H+ antiporter subunit D family protein [Burkholderiales bacterium]|nr:monovalent cation/H+ antiporter subunit D family protein [Burkholderiales bacterium]
MSAELLIGLALALPVFAAGLISVLGKAPNLREAVSLAAAAAVFLCVLSFSGEVLEGARPALRLVEIFPGLAVAFEIEPLGLLFALVASGLWFVSGIYSIGYMRGNGEAHQTRFFVCFALAIAAALGVAFAGNLLTLYLFYEALTFVTWPLVTHHGDAEAQKGGRTYLSLLLLTSMAFLLPAMAVTWWLGDTLDFTPGGILGGKLSEGAAAGLLALYAFGIGKAALMPIHRWLPAAMVAPTPVSALLHAVAVVKAGVFSIVKVVVYVFGLDFAAGAFSWLPWVAGFTIVAASIVALRADNLKRRLAYSTVSQLSYVVLAAAILAPLSLVGAILHIAAHAFGKITLFFAAGAIYTAAHKTQVSELDGLGRRMPWTFAAFGIGSLSMIGLPPAAGFVSKWFMVSGAVEAQHWLALGVIVASTLLNAGYFLPIVYRGFFSAERHAGHGAASGEAPWTMVLAMVATAGLTVLMFFFSDLPLALASRAVGG